MGLMIYRRVFAKRLVKMIKSKIVDDIKEWNVKYFTYRASLSMI